MSKIQPKVYEISKSVQNITSKRLEGNKEFGKKNY